MAKVGWLTLSEAAIGAVLAVAVQAQQGPLLSRESTHEVTFQDRGKALRPVWQCRGLLGVEENFTDEPIIFYTNDEGRTERIQLSIPGGRYLLIRGIAGSRDGSIAATFSAYNDAGQPGSFLALIRPDRSQQVVVRMWPYVADAATMGPSGQVFTIGRVRDGAGGRDSQHNVIKIFDAAGKLINTSVILARGDPEFSSGDAGQASLLSSSKDRLGWLTNLNEYIEFRFDGSELHRFPAPPGRAPDPFGTFALSSDNDVVVGTVDGDHLKLWSLQRLTGSWTALDISGTKPSTSALLGFDGQQLVIVDGRNSEGATISRYRIGNRNARR
jgi:hypothetical protein